VRTSGRRPELEGARGIVVAAVVGFHALRLVLERRGGDWGDVDPMWWWAGTGRLGVDAFFVLAGYLVVGSWHSCRRHTASLAASVGEFARRRTWRILPPYLVMLAIVVPLAAPELLSASHGWDLLRLVTVQQYLDPDLPGQVNLPIWSLTTEVHFYVVVPLVAWLVWRVGGWPTYLASAGLAVWWITTTWRGELPASLLPGRLDQFVIGAAAAGLLAKAAAGRRSRLLAALTHRAALPVLVTAMLALGLYHGATFQRADDGLLPQIVHPMATVVLGGLLVRLVAGPAVPLLVRPWLVTLGSFSFSLYLWHYPVLRRGQQLLGADHGVTVQSTAAMLLLVALSVGLAVLTHHLVELPAERARARRVRRVRVRSAVVQAELRLQDLQEVAGPEGDEAGGPARRGAHDGVVLTQLAQVAPVDAQRRRPVALDRQS
jgi:peptidoglycan/LPS O-acetylase OafA/YrhL